MTCAPPPHGWQLLGLSLFASCRGLCHWLAGVLTPCGLNHFPGRIDTQTHGLPDSQNLNLPQEQSHAAGRQAQGSSWLIPGPWSLTLFVAAKSGRAHYSPSGARHRPELLTGHMCSQHLHSFPAGVGIWAPHQQTARSPTQWPVTMVPPLLKMCHGCRVALFSFVPLLLFGGRRGRGSISKSPSWWECPWLEPRGPVDLISVMHGHGQNHDSLLL